METTTAAGWRTASGPTKDDWNKHRPLIERLYRGLSLKKVMERMERHEGFKATVKMYKDRIKQWGLDKKHKEDEMRAIVRKRKQRKDRGKDSVFSIRGRTIDDAELARYFKRKGLTIEEVIAQRRDQPTPEAVECRTPVLHQKHCGVVSTTPERLLFTIRSYVVASFEKGNWIAEEFDGYGAKYKKPMGHGLTNLHTQFMAAYRLFQNGKSHEAGKSLISATARIKDVMLSEHPFMLVYLFRVTLNILRIYGSSGYEIEILSAVMRYFHELGRIVLDKSHPLISICGWLNSLSNLELGDTVKKALEGIADQFTIILGPMHSLAFDTRLIFFDTVYRHDNLQASDAMLRNMLVECNNTSGTSTSQRLRIYLYLAGCRYSREDYHEAEQVCWKIIERFRDLDNASCCLRAMNEQVYVDAIYLLAITRRQLQDLGTAIARLTEAYQRRMSLFGQHDGRARLMLVQLEDWLLERGDAGSAAEVQEWRLSILRSENNE